MPMVLGFENVLAHLKNAIVGTDFLIFVGVPWVSIGRAAFVIFMREG